MTLKHTLQLVFLISLIGSLLSLYFGYFGDPIINFISGDRWNTTNALAPCSLCRYARIMLYPMVIISGIGLFYRDRISVVYCTALSLLGMLITGYQVLLQAGVFSTSSFCIPGSVSCAVIDWQYFGITIPMLACGAFVMIIGVSVRYNITHKK